MFFKLAKRNPVLAQKLIQALDMAAPAMQQNLKQVLLTGEGQFAVAEADVCAWLGSALALEYQSWLTYFTYGNIIRGLFRDTVAAVFLEHADQEAEHASQLLLWLTAMQQAPQQALQAIPAPPMTQSVTDMLRVLITQEQAAIASYRQGLTLAGTKEGFRQMIETIIETEQEHSNELLVLCTQLDNVEP